MKTRKLYLAASFLLFAFSLTAQDGAEAEKHSGKIIYEQTIKLDIQLEGMGEQFANALPKQRKSGKVLSFNPDASLYKNYKVDEEEEVMQSADGATIQIKMMEPDNKVFCDLSSGKQVEKREFMSRIFLIEKEIKMEAWKLNDEQKEVLGYMCRQAILDDEEKQVVAWYTPEIAVSSGPGSYVNLPGLVLEVNIDEGERTIVATSVEFGPVDDKEMRKPSKGKKVTEKEFEALVKEKMEEMGNDGAGSGEHMIMIKVER